MSSSLTDDKNIIIYINDFYPEFATAFIKLSEVLGRDLRGIMLIDAERKASSKVVADKEGFFEEIVVDFSDDAALRRAIKPLEKHLLLVSCDSERSQLYFKRVIPHVPYVNTPTESSLTFATDKGKMREMLLSYDPNISPKAIVVHDASEESIEKICAQLDFPLMVKPTTLDDAMLVDKVTDRHELQETLARSFTALHELYSEHRGLGDETMVVEEFIVGDLYTTDVYVDAVGEVNVLPFIKSQNASSAGKEGYYTYQSETYHTLTQSEIEQGARVARQAVHAVGLRSSVVHMDMFHQTAGWKIVELGARPGGYRQEIYELSYGIDHALNELLVKIGKRPQMPTAYKTHCIVFKIYAPKSGTVDSITGVEAVRTHPQMRTFHVEIKPGDKVLPSTQGGDILIGGLMHNTDYEQLKQDINAVRASITVHIKPN